MRVLGYSYLYTETPQIGLPPRPASGAEVDGLIARHTLVVEDTKSDKCDSLSGLLDLF